MTEPTTTAATTTPTTPRRVVPIAAASTGSAYDLAPPRVRDELTRVGKGTPMGELLRRYWHPVGVAADASTTPRQVRVLGEDLILFRDGSGRPGLLHPRCAHRGTSLFYGKVEAEGIRCCYHGWLFDPQGRCLDQPCEPGGGRRRDVVRQPWYPVEERYGLLFAYLGPPSRQPVLPRYSALEDLAPGEFVETNAESIGAGGGVIVPCNWTHHMDNLVDPFHVPILHGSISGVQFVDQLAVMPEVEWKPVPAGIQTLQTRKLPDGRTYRRVTETVLPTLRVVPDPRVETLGPVDLLGWILPIDDTHHRIYSAGRVREAGAIARSRLKMNGKFWWEMSDEEHQRFPSDWEAQVSQGDITVHSEEHLATSDRGVVMLRRMMTEQLQLIAAGGDPIGVHFDAAHERVELEAGNFIE